ncbi:glyceraldehyde dehydrogenase subunit beta [Sulfuracidifex tepidarius]|uniref:Glyceraldehyde dehydrogenase medium chain n=1 Tax=Sulfuracidifex tepidarius TaxID=1294262 RepID=A0A510E0Z7_9CREN|nr:glyceraldehyde dehydrogenase subunit beta [Sulfuracidifex tepidarius]BBG23409.1 Glyceraldehyde dehydrogenase medium chain [Sulfuracidifex tepidarius]BBG26161.1 Glyceraldehyde dehydrogenase medium chain [Sulfuracidifex tepidarius]
MYPSEFGYFKPDSLKEALDFLEEEDARPLAGGQSLIPMLKLRVISSKYLVDLNGIPSLSYVKDEGDKVRIGSLTRHAELTKDHVKSSVPLLYDAARQVGDFQVRNMGTIGGSISNADPAADYPSVLTALDAKVVLESGQGTRDVDSAHFFKGPFNPDIRRGEVVKEVVFPKLSGYTTKYVKVVRRAGDYAMVSLALALKVKDGKVEDLRLAYSGVSDTPYRAREAEKLLVGKEITRENVKEVAEAASSAVNPPSDVRGSSWYRREVMKVITMKALGGQP